MNRLFFSLIVLTVMLVGRSVVAQEPKPVPETMANLPVADGAQTESMWFYLQELRRYDDPQTVIRQNAEKKAKQRRARLAAQKWYGYSAGRPLASHTPFMGTYSPMWVGNGKDAFQWVGSGFATTAIKVDLTKITR